MATFASQEWIDALWAAARGDETLRDAAARWAHGPILLVIEADADASFPETVRLRVDIQQSETRDLRRVPEGTLAPFAITGSYTRWKQLVAAGGSSSVPDAIESSQLRLRGDLTAVMRNRAMFDRLVALAGGVPVAWPDDAAAAPTPAGAAS